MNKLTELWIKATGETEIEEYNNNVRELYDYTLQLEKENKQLKANRDEALQFIDNNMYERYCYVGSEDKLKEILIGGSNE